MLTAIYHMLSRGVDHYHDLSWPNTSIARSTDFKAKRLVALKLSKLGFSVELQKIDQAA